MDEPCSALDPIATLKVEELIDELKSRYTIVIVTHNMQQAARVADSTVFMLDGEVVEHAPTERDLHQPLRRAHRALRDRQVRLGLMQRDPPSVPRGPQGELEDQVIGGLDLVISAARPCAQESLSLSGRGARVRSSSPTTAGSTGAISGGPSGDPLVAGAAGAGGRRTCGSSRRCCTSMRCMERMGDQCVNIAKLVPLSGYESPKDKRDHGCDRPKMGAARRAPRYAQAQGRAAPRATCGPSPRGPRPARTPEINAAQPRDLQAARSRSAMTSTCGNGGCS